jgi:macrolide-specific efflux system membrane fusion protein
MGALSWKLGVVLLVAAIVGTAAVVARGNTGTPKAETRTATVARGNVTQTVTVSGSISAQGQARLAFKSGGKIAQIYVTSGQTVTLGQPLAKLDTTDLEAALATAQRAAEPRECPGELREGRAVRPEHPAVADRRADERGE